MKMLNPKFISPLEVWKRYIKNTVKFEKYVSISISERIRKALDQYFGNLAYHKIKKFKENCIVIECVDCMNEGSASVCDVHLGVVLGLIEAWFCAHYENKKEEKNNNCWLYFNRSK